MKHDRCRFCDYSEANGSAFAGISRDGRKVKFYRETNDFLCDVCVTSSDEAVRELENPDDTEV